MQWYRRVISFDQKDQVKLATSLIDMGDSLLEKLSASFEQLLDRLKRWLSKPFSYGSLLRVGLILGFCIGLYYSWHVFVARAGRFLRIFGTFGSLSSVRRQASRYMQKVRVKINQTDTEDAHLETLQTIYSQLEALRFGENGPANSAVAVFKKTRKALRRKTFRL